MTRVTWFSGQRQTMNHIVDTCLLTEFDVGLNILHEADVDAVTPVVSITWGGSVAEWLACWTQAQKGLCSNRSRNIVE